MKKSATVDMTQGRILPCMIRFTIPLVLGNLFQLTYNAADSMIIGRISGDASLAAVSAADPVMNLIILGITGICIGASVLMSNSYGAGEKELLRRELGALLKLEGVLVAAVTLLGLVFSRQILQLMQVKTEIMEPAVLYLRIIFVGMPFTCLYNAYAASLRSIGDSKTPIIFLALSSVLNICMDILFVAGFRWGAAGAGIATVIAQALSAVLCVLYVYRRVPLLHLSRDCFQNTRSLTAKTLKYGATTALQQCSQPLGKLFIQGTVNSLDIAAIAAFNAVGKIEDIALVPERSISDAMMTFTAQNDGAGQEQRVRRGLVGGMLLEMAYFAFICVTLLLLHRPLLSLFSTGQETVAEGGSYFRVLIFFYWLPAVTNGFQGFFRGLKHMKATLLATLTQISVRVVFTMLLVPRIGISGIAYACILGWTAQLIWVVPYCIVTLKRRAAQAKTGAGEDNI